MVTGGKPRGFAALSPEQRREVAKRGGAAAHASGRAHVWSAEEARAAGKIGGAKVSQDREFMAEIGRKGGQMRGRRAPLGATKGGTLVFPADRDEDDTADAGDLDTDGGDS